MKKIRLKGNNDKIFREVNALSQLSHRFIVRYYTTWVERNKVTSTEVSDASSASEDSYDEDTQHDVISVPNSSEQHPSVNSDELGVDMNELVLLSRSSFPSIHFEDTCGKSSGSGSAGSENGNGDHSVGGNSGGMGVKGDLAIQPPSKPPPKQQLSSTLYIQMACIDL